MNANFRLAGTVLAALVLTTTLVQAEKFTEIPEAIDFAPIAITDNTPVNVEPRDYAPIDVEAVDYTPIDIDGETAGKGRKLILEVAIGCKVAGTPVEFPDDLVLINQGQALSAGTVIKWKVRSAGEGFVELGSDLPTGATIKAKGVLGGGVEAGKPCTAKIV